MAYGGSRARGRIGELQLPAYTTATAMQDPNRVCDRPQLMAMPDP